MQGSGHRRDKMKAMDVIKQVDILEPNQYGVGQKLRWLAMLDGQVYDCLLYTSDAADE